MAGRQKFNAKRRIRKGTDEALLIELSGRVVYVANPAHKSNPGDFRLTPPASPRADKALCDGANVFDRQRAQELLREGILRGLVSVQERDGLPQNVWAVSDNGIPLEAQLDNQTTATYHGCPMPEADPLEPRSYVFGESSKPMAERFEIALEEWLPGEDGDPYLQATTAEISIKVGSRYATEVEDRRAKTVRTSIRASAALLASWLLSNWWRLRWEPYKKFDQMESLDWELAHSLAATGGGYVWPPLTFASDEASIMVKCEGQTKSDSEELAPIRYLNSFAGIIEPSGFESAVMAFVERVLDRLNTIRVKNTLVHELWAENDFWVTTKQQDARSFAGATSLLLYIQLWQGLQSFSNENRFNRRWKRTNLGPLFLRPRYEH